MKTENANENLMTEYAKDPRRGFEQIYRTYADRLLQYAIHSFRFSSEEAEDAVHEALLPWVQNPQKMSGVKNLKAYLYASMRNACLKKAGAVSNSTMPEDVAAAEGPDLHLQADVANALKQLPGEQCETVYLKIWGDLTFAEIAELQNASLQTIASRYRYALAKLKEILQWNP
ncbi:MAG: sigma-70 family RNA polymerase sigma factor [Candidatus Riflebacteria bacterium]|nr:sigma-70 family RNA polymerase sigma factor [Candidatus Riflebacteria bacterium]